MVQLLGGIGVMASKEEPVERRKHKRFEVPIGAFVVIGPHSSRVGRIIDISMGGLAFRHVDEVESSEELHELDVFHENDFCLRHVPCEAISDLETYESPFGSFIIRESAVQFGEMTPQRMLQLQRFIQKHTIRGWFEPPANLSKSRRGSQGVTCHKQRIVDFCKARDVGLETFVECLEEDPLECPYSMFLDSAHYCKHPLRIDIAKKMKK
jgi:hypothetical protein